MSTDDALLILSALAHPTRLEAFRLLIRHEPEGMSTGELVEASGLSQSTFSTHLAVMAKKYFETKFVKISAPDAPFFVTKLQVKVLPCLIYFRDGVAFDRLVGFEELGGKDDYPTAKLERTLLDAGVVAPIEKNDSDSEDEMEEMRREATSRMMRSGGFAKGSDDEDSDFD